MCLFLFFVFCCCCCFFVCLFVLFGFFFVVDLLFRFSSFLWFVERTFVDVVLCCVEGIDHVGDGLDPL